MKHSRPIIRTLAILLGLGLVSVAGLATVGSKVTLFAGETVMASGKITAIDGVWIVSMAKGIDLSGYGDLKFQFDGGKLYGNSPCRSFNAEYRFTDGRLQILRPDVFGSMCSEAAMDAESLFLRLLDETDQAQIDENGLLVLLGFGEVTMQARRDG